ncbi:MAG TPA: sigma-54 dependent transcriptional regulator [Candidatus Baltobacteraceae bacterium]|nr:sigma-54 dependent transcriptional regulator [Candidatus Baltobacteraceae bacterium]
MSETHPRVPLLAIDYDAANLQLIRDALEDAPLEIHTASDPQSGLEAFKSIRPRIVLVDLMMPIMSGMDLLERMLRKDPGVEVILMTGHYSTDSAVVAIKKGARDFLDKPLNLQKLRARISDLLAELREKEAAFKLERQMMDVFQFEGMIGRSPLMLDVFAKIRRVAPHFQTVLITGPTGTGKELVARSLHNLRNAGSGPFAVCNCAAVVDTLFESELFGYVKGAFTGASEDKIGLFEYANRGTVFLDEIGELPLPAQAKLLRVLQEKEVHRVGSPVPRKVDVRVLAATNRDLTALVKEGKFREDLYYRLGMIEISMPRLADRKEDLQFLERFMLERYAKQYGKTINGITRRAQNCLAAYSWPGNVRELENVLSLAVMMAQDNLIDLDDLPKTLLAPESEAGVHGQKLLTLEELQFVHLQRVLEHVKGDKTRAAEILGVSRSTLYNLLSRAKARSVVFCDHVPGATRELAPEAGRSDLSS